jgi:hypothetical protein
MKGLQTKHQAQYSFKKSSRQERTTLDTCSTRIKEFTLCSGRYPRFLCDGISSHGYNSIRHQFSQSMTRGVPNFSITPLRRNILISASEPRGEGGGSGGKIMVKHTLQKSPLRLKMFLPSLLLHGLVHCTVCTAL